MTTARGEPLTKARTSLRVEHVAAMAAVHPQLRQCLGRGLITFDLAVAAALQPKADEAALTRARRAITRLDAALETPQVRQAAWDDVVVAAESAASLDDGRAAVDQLEALLERAGFDWKVRVGKLVAILERSAVDIAEASVALRRRRPGRWPAGSAQSPLSADARLNLCRDFVALRADPTTCVVWLAYRRARLPEAPLHSGGVAFVRLKVARDAVRSTGSLLGAPFANEDSLPSDDPDDDIAIVQVILEDHLPRDAVADAEAIVGAVTGDVAADAIGTTWSQLGWTRVRFASGGGGTNYFATPDEVADIRRSYDHERTAQRLVERADRLTNAVRRRPPYDRLIADALRSRADAKHTSPRNAIVLLGSAVEAAVAASGLDIADIRDLAVAEWPWAAIRAEIRQATFLAVGRDDMRFRHDPRLSRLAEQIITDIHETWSDLVSTEAVVRLRDDLVDVADNAIETRNAEQLVQMLTDSRFYLQRIERLQEDARVQQERSRRVRNAFVHGNPVTAPALASARAWWDFVADVATHVATDGHGRSARRTLASMYARRERFAEKLRNGTPPVQAFDR